MELLRAVGGLLLATGALVTVERLSTHHELNQFGSFVVLFVPAMALYALALDGGRPLAPNGPRPSQSVLAVLALLLGPVVLLQFLALLGASTSGLDAAGVFALSALFALHTARRLRVAYAMLLAGIAALIAWTDMWGQILGSHSPATSRWLLLTGAALLVAAAGLLARKHARGATDLATAGGIAAVSAGVLGIVVGAVNGVLQGIATLGESSSSSSSSTLVPTSHSHPVAHLVNGTSGLQSFGWNLYLLIVSLALVWVGARVRARGPAYVGGAGLLAFVISIAAEITRIEVGRSSTGGILGWPLALLVLGVAGLASSTFYRRET